MKDLEKDIALLEKTVRYSDLIKAGYSRVALEQTLIQWEMKCLDQSLEAVSHSDNALRAKKRFDKCSKEDKEKVLEFMGKVEPGTKIPEELQKIKATNEYNQFIMSTQQAKLCLDQVKVKFKRVEFLRMQLN